MARNRAKKETLLKQIQNNLDNKLAIGESKKADKLKYLRDEHNQLVKDKTGNKVIAHKDLTKKKIYSWSTYKTYLKHCNYFAQYCRENHNCKTLIQCKQYADEYLQKLIDDNKSASTIKMTVSALAKLYNCSSSDFIETPERKRKDIKRSRIKAVRDKNFSETNNAELINFCRCTGLRRAELSQIRGTDLIEKDGEYFLHICRGTKGGRERVSLICGSKQEVQTIVNRMRKAGSNKVWNKVSSNADIHSYRSDYCNRVYKLHERDINTLNSSEIYYCRRDLKSVKYDKKAMLIASKNLGHNRINVIASNYLRATT